MNRRSSIILGILIVTVGIQFIQPAANQNGRMEQSMNITKQFPVPSRVQAILENSCYDCHSNNTRYPWYAKIQPGAWWLASHIRKGKADLNFNEFGRYSTRQQRSKFKSIAGSVKDGTMPLRSYTLMHQNAILSQQDKKLIVNWALSMAEGL